MLSMDTGGDVGHPCDVSDNSVIGPCSKSAEMDRTDDTLDNLIDMSREDSLYAGLPVIPVSMTGISTLPLMNTDVHSNGLSTGAPVVASAISTTLSSDDLGSLEISMPERYGPIVTLSPDIPCRIGSEDLTKVSLQVPPSDVYPAESCGSRRCGSHVPSSPGE